MQGTTTVRKLHADVYLIVASTQCQLMLLQVWVVIFKQIADAPVSRVTGQFIYGNADTPWLFPM